MKITNSINQYTLQKVNFYGSISMDHNINENQQAQKYIDDADSNIEFTLRRAKNFFDSLEPQAVSSKIDTIKSRAQELFDSQDPQRKTCTLYGEIACNSHCPLCEGSRVVNLTEEYYFKDGTLTSYTPPYLGGMTRDRITFSKDDPKSYIYINERDLPIHEYDEDTKSERPAYDTYSYEFQDGKLKKVIAPNHFSEHPLTISYDENGKISRYQNRSRKDKEIRIIDIYYKNGNPDKIIVETESCSDPNQKTTTVYIKNNNNWISTSC